jgi:hypothetical protein
MLKKGLTSLGLPYKIGCGLAGGDWENMLNIIFDIFEDQSVSVILYRKNNC